MLIRFEDTRPHNQIVCSFHRPRRNSRIPAPAIAASAITIEKNTPFDAKPARSLWKSNRPTNHFAGQVSVIFGTRLGVPVAGGTLQTAINFNNARASAEMPFFNQDIFDLANALEPGPDDPQPIFGGLTYNEALAIDRNADINGMNAAISQSQPRCRRVRHRQSGVGYRSDLWRPLHFLDVGSCCGPPDIPSSASASSGQHSVSPR